MKEPPLIGITISRTETNSGQPLLAVAESYVDAILQAGGDPVLLPLKSSNTGIQKISQLLDGILLTGGGDVDPQRYGSASHPLVAGVDQNRDHLEIFLTKYAISKNLPLMGICRGLQVINIAMGGTIYEDILEQKPAALRHNYALDFPRHYLAHSVEVVRDSQLFTIINSPSPLVNSLHHQGIKMLAQGLRATAFAPDGLIEAVEIENHPFGLAVQWHPECLPDEARMDALFRAFIESTIHR